ncbi:MAG: hypothetical protein KHY19_02560 [Coprobacillus cateniformis]|nr:hypothetical protein [Coprobacillus cateniformis]
MLKFTISDWLQLFGIIASFVTSIVAICISIKTLQQNNKMIEDSTRPVISIYSKFLDGRLYIITKNFGNSPCIIDYIDSDMNITEEESQSIKGNPYSKIKNITLPPQGSVISSFIPYRLKTRIFNFEVKYHSDTHSYIEKFCVDCDAENPFPDMHTSVKKVDDATCKISRTLEDILKTKL